MDVLDKNDRTLLGGDISRGDMKIIYARREEDGTIYATIRPQDPIVVQRPRGPYEPRGECNPVFCDKCDFSTGYFCKEHRRG